MKERLKEGHLTSWPFMFRTRRCSVSVSHVQGGKIGPIGEPFWTSSELGNVPSNKRPQHPLRASVSFLLLSSATRRACQWRPLLPPAKSRHKSTLSECIPCTACPWGESCSIHHEAFTTVNVIPVAAHAARTDDPLFEMSVPRE